MPLRAGDKLGPYKILAPIGAGGMGEVYVARDTRLGRKVALKVLSDEIAQDKRRQVRFEQEAKAASALNHPNIACVYDIGSESGIMYIVSELVEGETLRALIARGPIAHDAFTAMAIRLADAVGAAHSAGIIHRDLKPGNIMLTRDGRPKILDFGLAKQIKHSAGHTESAETQPMTEPGVVMGTAGYMSPEQVRAEAADPRSDIFSLGAILYEMASGKRAFSGASQFELMAATLEKEPPPLPPRIDRGLESIIRRCLQKELDRRFQNASDLAFALARAADGFDPKPAPVPRNSTSVVWVGIAVLVLGITGGLAYRAVARRTAPPKPLGPVEIQAKSQSDPVPLPPRPVEASPTVSTKKPVETSKPEAAKRTDAPPATVGKQPVAPVPEPSKKETPPVPDAQRMENVARDLAHALGDGRYADATRNLNEKASLAVSSHSLERDWKSLRDQAGDVRWLSPPHLQGTNVEFVWCEFQRGISDLRVVFDKDGRVDALSWTFHAVSDREADGMQATGAASPERAREAYDSAQKLLGQQKFDEAIRLYDEAIQARAEYAEAYQGRCHSEAASRPPAYGRAVLDCTRAIRMSPDYALAYSWRGFASRALGELEQAIPAFDEAIRLEPNWLFYYWRASAHEAAGQYELCVRDATEEIHLDPEQSSGWAQRASCYERLQRYDQATEDLTQMIGQIIRHSNNYSISYLSTQYVRRGALYIRAKQYQKALADFNEAIRLKPDLKDAYNNRGFAKDMLGDAAGAAADREYARKLP